MNRFAITIILALASLSAWPQAAPISGSVINQYGQPVAGANVRICSVTSAGPPCTPTAAIFSDFNLTQATGNPTQTDQNGNFTVFVGALPFPNLYTVQAFPVPANPSGLPYTWVVPGPWCSLGGCAFTGPIYAPQITTPILITPSVSKGLELYSSAACAVNSNLLNGGGTDDSACIQGLLNKITAAGGGTLHQDGPSLISAVNTSLTGQTTALQMGPNTTIECGGNGGFYLANFSNVTMLGNNLVGNPAASFQKNMEIDDCTFNENGANQSRYELGNSNNEWVFGMWFSGFDTLRINHIQMWNARTFAYLFANGLALTVNDSTAVQLAGFGAGGNNHDGLHFWGTLQNINVKRFQDVFGDDDPIAINTDEGVVNYHGLVNNGGWQPARCPTSGGAISEVQIDDVYLHSVNDPLRWIGYGPSNDPPGDVATVSNIILKNFHGTVTGHGATQGGVTASNSITVDGWSVLPNPINGLTVPPGGNPLSLTAISNEAPVTIPSGNNVAVQLSPTFIAYNNVLFNGVGTFGSGNTYILGEFDSAGDFILGSTQPTVIFSTAEGLVGAFDASGNFGVGSNAAAASDPFVVSSSGAATASSLTISGESGAATYLACYTTGGKLGHCATTPTGTPPTCGCTQ